MASILVSITVPPQSLLQGIFPRHPNRHVFDEAQIGRWRALFITLPSVISMWDVLTSYSNAIGQVNGLPSRICWALLVIVSTMALLARIIVYSK